VIGLYLQKAGRWNSTVGGSGNGSRRSTMGCAIQVAPFQPLPHVDVGHAASHGECRGPHHPLHRQRGNDHIVEDLVTTMVVAHRQSQRYICVSRAACLGQWSVWTRRWR